MIVTGPDHHISEAIRPFTLVDIVGLVESRVAYHLLGNDIVLTMEKQHQASR